MIQLFEKVVEIEETDVEIKNPVMVFSNFDYTKLLGKAFVYKEDGVLKADIDLAMKCDYNNLYPAIGFAMKGDKKVLMAIGLCDTQNEDNRIQTLGS